MTDKDYELKLKKFDLKLKEFEQRGNHLDLQRLIWVVLITATITAIITKYLSQ